MAAQNIAVGINKIALFRNLFVRALADKISVAPFGDEADLLRVLFVRAWKSRVLGDLAHLVLRVFAERHQCARELLLRELVEHVGLVLADV